MENELLEILKDEGKGNEEKAKAVLGLVGNSFVPAEKYNKLATERDNLKNSLPDIEKDKLSLEEERRNFALLHSRAEAKDILRDAGMPKDKIEKILAKIVTEDFEKTKELATMLCETISEEKESTKAQIQAEIVKKSTEQPGTGGKGDVNQKAQLEKLYKEAEASNNMTEMARLTGLMYEQEQTK